MSGRAATATPDRVDAIQVLRFVAAMLVVLGHVQHELVRELTPEGSGWHAARLVDWGLGVDIFFVISGFVMYYIMHDAWGRGPAAADFLRRRLIRVVPPYWLFTTLAVILAVRIHSLSAPVVNVIFSYLFIPGPYCGEYCFPVYTLGWSLNYEMLFYALFSTALLFSRRAGLTLLASMLALLLVAGRLAPTGWTLLRFWGNPIIGEFAFGIGLAIVYRRGARLSVTAGWALVAGGMALAVVAWDVSAYRYIWRLWTGGVPAALIVGGATLALRPAREGAFAGFLIAGGDASYALYLSHPVAAKLGAALAKRAGVLAAAPSLYVVVAVAVAVLAALALHRWAERPMLRYLTRRISRLGDSGFGDGVRAAGTRGEVLPPAGG